MCQQSESTESQDLRALQETRQVEVRASLNCCYNCQYSQYLSGGKACTVNKEPKKEGLLLHPSHPTVNGTRDRTGWNLLAPSVRTNKCTKITGLVTASHWGWEWQLCVKWVEQGCWGFFWYNLNENQLPWWCKYSQSRFLNYLQPQFIQINRPC